MRLKEGMNVKCITHGWTTVRIGKTYTIRSIDYDYRKKGDIRIFFTHTNSCIVIKEKTLSTIFDLPGLQSPLWKVLNGEDYEI